MSKYLILLTLLFLAHIGRAQDDSASYVLPHKLPADTLEVKEDVVKKNPKKAALLSAVLPGAGQIYNGKYWKLPIIYTGIGVSAFFIIQNRSFYVDYKEAYLNDLAAEEDSSIVLSNYGLQNVSTGQLREAADASRKNMEYAYIGLVAIYALQIVDATVDAHLFQFDVSDDLSMRVEPSFDIYRNTAALPGARFTLTF